MSNNPSTKTFKENTIERLARNVMTGTISRHPVKARGLTYLFMGKATGQTPPSVAEIKARGYIGFQNSPEQEKISSSFAIDVYCLANKQNTRDDWGILTVWAS